MIGRQEWVICAIMMHGRRLISILATSVSGRKVRFSESIEVASGPRGFRTAQWQGWSEDKSSAHWVHPTSRGTSARSLTVT